MHDLNGYLILRRCFIHAAINDVSPTANFRPKRLHEVIRYSLLVGGKRLSSILCLATFEAAGGRQEAALVPAMALEYPHAYMLSHDDLPCGPSRPWIHESDREKARPA